MPRPPSYPHVLRTARNILGLTQKDLAARVGIATVTLQKFENGDASISREIAFRIANETFLDLHQLIENKDPHHPLDWIFGTPLTKESLDPIVHTERDTEKEIAKLVPMIRELLNFSIKKKSFIWVSKSIWESLKQIKAEFQGEAGLKQFPAKRGRPPKRAKSARKAKLQPL